MDQLDPAGVQERGVSDEKGFGPLARNRCECCLDLAAGAGTDDLDLQPGGASRCFHISQCWLGICCIGGIDKNSNAPGLRHQLSEELKAFCGQLGREKIHACKIAVRPREARDQAKPDRVIGDDEDDGNRARRRFCGGRDTETARSRDDGDPSAHQVGHQLRQPVESILGPAVFDRYVLAFDIAGVSEALAKSAETIRERVWRSGVEKPNHRHGLLRVRRHRPRNRRTAEQRDELASVYHSIELHLPPSQGSPRQHSALASIKSGAHCSAGFWSGV